MDEKIIVFEVSKEQIFNTFFNIVTTFGFILKNFFSLLKLNLEYHYYKESLLSIHMYNLVARRCLFF